MEDNTGGQKAMYNQASYLQGRMDKIYDRIDTNSINLFDINLEKSVISGRIIKNYEVVLSDLNSLYLYICSKLTKEEKEGINKIRIKVRDIVRDNPPFLIKGVVSFSGTKQKKFPSYKNQDLISDTIQEYRILLETSMEEHQFNNPSKEDVTKSIVKM